MPTQYTSRTISCQNKTGFIFAEQQDQLHATEIRWQCTFTFQQLVQCFLY